VFAAAVVWEMPPAASDAPDAPDASDASDALRDHPTMRLIRDSKTLSAAQRGRARAFIEANAAAWAVGTADAAEIDRVNILKASHAAMHRAIDLLLTQESPEQSPAGIAQGIPQGIPPRWGGWAIAGPGDRLAGAGRTPHLLVDGDRFRTYISPTTGDFVPHACFVEGDAKYLAIAAASILAKTHRDEHVLTVMHPRHPGYAWDRNKCYGSPAHLAALETLGVTPEHRRTFAPVRKLL
jgi:ribonuclease HII